MGERPWAKDYRAIVMQRRRVVRRWWAVGVQVKRHVNACGDVWEWLNTTFDGDWFVPEFDWFRTEAEAMGAADRLLAEARAPYDPDINPPGVVVH